MAIIKKGQADVKEKEAECQDPQLNSLPPVYRRALDYK
jgi:hypothetical protein